MEITHVATHLQERPKCTVSKDYLIRYRNSCGLDEDDLESSSGAWRRDEDPTEDKEMEYQPSSIKVGYLYHYLPLSGIIFGQTEFCWDLYKKRQSILMLERFIGSRVRQRKNQSFSVT